MKVLTAMLVLAVLLGAELSGQSKDQWEYLVLGQRSGFTDLATLKYLKSADVETLNTMKVLRYGSDLADLSEAVTIEQSADKLGQAGWELVTVVGMIGGDQEWIFKRKASPSVLAAEQKASRKNVETILKAQADQERAMSLIPIKDIDAANAAYAEAKDAQAETLAPDAFQVASDANDALQANLTAKDYSKTSALAKAAVEASEAAKTQAMAAAGSQ